MANANQHTGHNRTVQFMVRLTEKEAAELRELAWKARKSAQDFVRERLGLKSSPERKGAKRAA